jgi:uncharacterized membrane protein HdeD (DUF308 family)
MTSNTINQPDASLGNRWLKPYYFTRAAFSIVWVLAAFTLGKSMPVIAGLLLLAYPAWDAAANFVDAQRNGGMMRNPTQALNVAASALTTVAVAITLANGMSSNVVLGVFGVWAALAGAFQLGTGLRRWKTYGAQWVMILSGGQSVIAGLIFIKQATGPQVNGITDIAPYAAVGAFYFLISAIWLAVADMRRRNKPLIMPA